MRGKEAAKGDTYVGHVSESWGETGSSVPTQAGGHKSPHSSLSPKTLYCRTKLLVIFIKYGDILLECSLVLGLLVLFTVR